MSTAVIPLLPHQAEYIRSTARYTALIGGFGSGKTFAGITKAIKEHVYYKTNIAYYLPTYRLVKDVGIPNFESLLKKHYIEHRTNKIGADIKTPYGVIMLRSFEDPDQIVAYEVGYSVIDEADRPSMAKMKIVYREAYGRNRLPLHDGSHNKVDFVSTPHGHKFLYDFFVRKHSPDKQIVKAKTDDNVFINKDFIEGMNDEYSDEEVKAFRYGEFVNLTSGLVYRSYNRHANATSERAYSQETLHIGIDFNIGKMSAVISVLRPNDKIHIVDEIYGRHDTRDLAEGIRAKYPHNPIMAYPDSSGVKRTTNSNITDIEILREYFTVIVNTNPSVRDRVNKMNAAFKNARGDRDLLVNIDACPHLVISLESQAYNDHGKPDKNNDFDHLPDGAGYLICGRKGYAHSELPPEDRYSYVPLY